MRRSRRCLDRAEIVERPVAAGSEYIAAGEMGQGAQDLDRPRRQRHRMAFVGFHARGRNRPQRPVEIDLAPRGLTELGPTHAEQQQQLDVGAVRVGGLRGRAPDQHQLVVASRAVGAASWPRSNPWR